MSKGLSVAVDMDGTMGLDLGGAGIQDGERRERCGGTAAASFPGLGQLLSLEGQVLPYLILFSVTVL